MMSAQQSTPSALRLEEEISLKPSLPLPERQEFKGQLLIIGLGTIGLGVIPLILKHIDFSSTPGGASSAIRVITGPDRLAVAKDLLLAKLGITFQCVLLTEANFTGVLDTYQLGDGDFVLNVSVDVSSCALLAYCNARGAMYLDTVVEPWSGVYYDSTLSYSSRTNYAMREDALVLKRKFGPGAPTAIITCGANPGLVSCFVKEAMLELERERNDNDGSGEEKKSGGGFEETSHSPMAREDWARLAMDLGVQSVHIAERDTQFSAQRKEKGEFVNTWSVDGFLSEGNQPAELGWGTFEKTLPADAGDEHTFGPNSAIFLKQPGASTMVRSWTPQQGPFHGFLITHSESISIATYLTLFGPEGKAVYRPTVHYSYLPCDDAIISLHELRGNNYAPPLSKRVLMQDIVGGADELGVLLMGQRGGKPFAYWYGSNLTAVAAQQRAEHNSATSLQVTSTIVAGMLWALRNPRRGIVEPEELPHTEILDFVRPYVSPVVGVHTTWTPLLGRGIGGLFEESLDEASPFQFSNVRVGNP